MANINLYQLHTDLGELKIEVFCEAVPKTAEVGSFRPRCALTFIPCAKGFSRIIELSRSLRFLFL